VIKVTVTNKDVYAATTAVARAHRSGSADDIREAYLELERVKRQKADEKLQAKLDALEAKS
jgi:predicted negative regulator of RcsB-dependent stress response